MKTENDLAHRKNLPLTAMNILGFRCMCLQETKSNGQISLLNAVFFFKIT